MTFINRTITRRGLFATAGIGAAFATGPSPARAACTTTAPGWFANPTAYAGALRPYTRFGRFQAIIPMSLPQPTLLQARKSCYADHGMLRCFRFVTLDF
jgi:hypothetical protein